MRTPRLLHNGGQAEGHIQSGMYVLAEKSGPRVLLCIQKSCFGMLLAKHHIVLCSSCTMVATCKPGCMYRRHGRMHHVRCA